MAAVYVLTTLMGEGKAPKEWRPVGVVTSEDVADQWVAAGNNNDWIPFEVDDLGLTGLSGDPTPFKPKPTTPNEQRAIEIAKKMEETNARLLKIISDLKEQLELCVKGKGKRGAKKYPLYEGGGPRHARDCGFWQFPVGENCTCKKDKLPPDLPNFPKGHFGCRDCGADYDGWHSRNCPRVQQQTIAFASSLLKKKEVT